MEQGHSTEMTTAPAAAAGWRFGGYGLRGYPGFALLLEERMSTTNRWCVAGRSLFVLAATALALVAGCAGEPLSPSLAPLPVGARGSRLCRRVACSNLRGVLGSSTASARWFRRGQFEKGRAGRCLLS